MELFSNEKISVDLYFNLDKVGFGFWFQFNYGLEINFLFLTLELTFKSFQEKSLESLERIINEARKNGNN